MFRSILVVCIGNICRSPVGERLLRAGLPNCDVGSAGLGAVIGSEADPVTTEAAAEHGIDLSDHVARQFTAELGGAHDLILTMEPRHRDDIHRRYPHLSGRTLLFDQWTGGSGIPDPHGRPIEEHRRALALIMPAAQAWIDRLAVKPGT